VLWCGKEAESYINPNWCYIVGRTTILGQLAEHISHLDESLEDTFLIEMNIPKEEIRNISTYGQRAIGCEHFSCIARSAEL